MKIVELSLFKSFYFISNQMRIVGLDVGDTTIGVAVSDSSFLVATSLDTVSRKYVDYDISSLLALVSMYKVGLIVFGWPVQMNGQQGEQCAKTMEFMTALSSEIPDMQFAKWDERFSTRTVERMMVDANLSRKKRSKVVDKTAAGYILQGAMDRIRNNSARS